MKLPPASLRFLCNALLLALWPWAAVPTPAAEAPPKDDDIAVLRAAADHAVRQYSKGLSTATDELFLKWWWNRAEATNAALAFQQTIRGMRPELVKRIGEPMPTEYEYLGSIRLGAHCINFVFLQKHVWLSLPIAIGFIRYDGQWRFNHVSFADNALPYAHSFHLVERAADLPAVPVQAPNLHRPATYADIRQACDTFMERIAKEETTQAIKELMQEHWVSPGNTALQIEALEFQFRKDSLQIPADLGRPLPGKAEFLGLSRLGANRLTLHYMLHHERGIRPYLFAFYKPNRAWQLYNVVVDNTPEGEWQALYSLRSATAPVSPAQRPLLEIASKTATGIAQSSPNALDEVMRDWWMEPADSPKAQGFLAGYQAYLPLLQKKLGPSVGNAAPCVGTKALGKDLLIMLHLNLRERDILPISTSFTRHEGKWKVMSLSIGDKAYDQHLSLNQFTILSPTSQAGPAPLKPAIPDLSLLEKSCHRFMTRITTGQAKGAIRELMAAHKTAADDNETELLQSEATFLINQFKPSPQTGNPLLGQFEYLAIVNRGSYLARLVFLQRFEGYTGVWSFLFYRPKDEWLIDHVASPESPSRYLSKLEILERANPAGSVK